MAQFSAIKQKVKLAKESKMRLSTLKKTIQAELLKVYYPPDWLFRTHGLRVLDGFYQNEVYIGPTVQKTYRVEYSVHPKERSHLGDDDGFIRGRSHSEKIPLKDYWRYALQGRGL